MHLLSITIPISEPIIIIALVLFIILIGPVIFERIRIPSIVGLLISGAIIGPNGISLLSPDLEFSLFGTIGLLYLMFLAGLEIDLVDFKVNKIKSGFIGLSTFIIPLLLGFVVCKYLLDYETLASWLIASMFSSHTLVSYPILGKLGIVNKSVVTIVVGATIIADILALVAMELVTNFALEGFEQKMLLILGFKFLVFFGVVFFIVPKISRIFLTKYEGDLGVQYIFVLFMLMFSSLIAFLLEIEPILGAFFSGLVLNRQIINTSPLYKRIEFIGNNLFIPFFLISIGMLANFKTYVDQPKQIFSLLVVIAVAFIGKYLVSLLSRIVLKTSKVESNLIFGLTVSRAASAIAIILVGYNIGMLDDTILNATVILILVTSIASSYITQKAGKDILLKENNTLSAEVKIHQKILVPMANPINMKSLLEFALLIKDIEDTSPVYPLTIFTNRENIREKIFENQKIVQKVIDSFHTDLVFETSSRIDSNVTDGIVRACKELLANSIIIGWNDHNTPFHILFGTVLNKLLKKTERMVIVVKESTLLKNTRAIYLFCPQNAEYEKGFLLWLDTIVFMAKKLQTIINVSCQSESTINQINIHAKKNNLSNYFKLASEEDIAVKKRYRSTDLLIFVHSRKDTISYDKHYETLTDKKNLLNKEINAIIIYPEQ
ncbi:MAG: cation:proton antiporter [Bacteroidales bacterium]|nr:cation:proton antiporter [Bacteroidales bacterium]